MTLFRRGNHLQAPIFTQLLLIFAVLCSGCEDDEKGNSGGASLSATIDGQRWEASAANGAHGPVISSFPNGSIQIEGFKNSSSDKQTLVFQVRQNFHGTGTYDGDDVYAMMIIDGDDYKTYTSDGNATLTFTEYEEDETASGTFSGTLLHEGNELVITDGEFENLRIDYCAICN